MGDFEKLVEINTDESSFEGAPASRGMRAGANAPRAKAPSGSDSGSGLGASSQAGGTATHHHRFSNAVDTAAQSSSRHASELKLGKGLDVGTANLVSAVQNEKGGITISKERNAFIDIQSDVYSKRMLTQLKVPYVMFNEKMIVLGDAAFELSNIFGRETRRPMKDGLISPDEVDALPMIRLIIEKVLGQPQSEGERVYFSVPAESVDRKNNIIYHQGLFEGLLRKMGYAPKSLNEGHAVVFSELAEQDFTGIGISFGGGMVNVCVCYKTIPAVSFSISRGGDWIDQNVANVLGMNATKAAFIKEQGVNLMNPKSREEEAIVIYYRNLINYVLQNIRAKFVAASDVPEFRDSIEIVCSGGTSMIEGFTEVFRDELNGIRFPLEIKSVRRASEPLTSVAKGCLIAAAIGEAEE